MFSPFDAGGVDAVRRFGGNHIALLQTQPGKPYVSWVRCLVPGKMGLRFIITLIYLKALCI